MFAIFMAKLGAFFGAFGAACNLPGSHTNQFFFFPHWWEYLSGHRDELNTCVPNVNFPDGLWLIGLAILDMLLALAGFVAVVSIIIAGAQLILAEGSPEKATNARSRLINSLVGLAIAASATGIVRVVGNVIQGNGTGLPHVTPTNAHLQGLLNAAFAIFGALAFLYLILAGFRFITSGDNSTKVAEARRQIIYALGGLLIIALASTIVNFVLGKL
jgi:hypothetical protein